MITVRIAVNRATINPATCMVAGLIIAHRLRRALLTSVEPPGWQRANLYHLIALPDEPQALFSRTVVIALFTPNSRGDIPGRRINTIL